MSATAPDVAPVVTVEAVAVTAASVSTASSNSLSVMGPTVGRPARRAGPIAKPVPPRRSPPAGDVQEGPGAVRGGGRQQEEDALGDLLRLPAAAQREPRRDPVDPAGLAAQRVDAGVDQTGAHRV